MAELPDSPQAADDTAGREAAFVGEVLPGEEVTSDTEVIVERQVTVESDPGSEAAQETVKAVLIREETLVIVRQRMVLHHHAGVLPSLQSLLYVLVVSLFAITFIVQPIRIPSGSMEPTLLVGDFLLMNKQAVAEDKTGPGAWLLPPVAINRGDVVVFHDPVDDPSVHLVKRVIGVPGDRIHLLDGEVYRNDVALAEPYAVHRRAPEDTFRDDFPNLNTMDGEVNTNWWIRLRGMVRDGEITVPANSYFVMGDNRNNSEDSRYWGFVPREAIVGKPFLVYFSFQQPGSRGAWDVVRWRRLFEVVR